MILPLINEPDLDKQEVKIKESLYYKEIVILLPRANMKPNYFNYIVLSRHVV